MKLIAFYVIGTPGPKGSKKVIRHRHSGRTILIDDNPKVTKRWQKDVAQQARLHYRGGLLLDVPLEVILTFFLPRPKSHFGTGRNAGVLLPSAPRYPGVKPDLDKLERATLDALEGILFTNDSRVIHTQKTKLYAQHTPGAYIAVQPFDPATKEIEANGTHQEGAGADLHPRD